MSETIRTYDLLAIGRSSIDLYANEIGAPFAEIKSFAAYVGGCPTNISVGARRLGLRVALVNPLGDDLVGDFVLRFLAGEGVDTRFAPRKRGRRTSAFLLAIEPPDHFSIVPYRDNCADLELTIDDVRAAPVAESRALLITGSGLSRQPSRDATLFAAELARRHETKVVLDLDFRPELWSDERAYGVAMRSALHLCNVVIGTREEVAATFDMTNTDVGAGLVPARLSRDASSGQGQALPLQAAAQGASFLQLHARGVEALVVKRGAESTIVHLSGGEQIEAATFPVDVLNVLGAGDAFAGGFIYGYLKGWSFYRAARTGNACGALVVTRHGCANFMPYEEEVLSFISERGGF